MKRWCPHAGCPRTTTGGPCALHRAQRERQRDAERGELLKLYRSRAWKRLRAEVLAEEPVCEACHKAPSREVHHVLDARTHPALRLERTNLQALCSPCHSAETARRKGGA